MNGCVSLFSGIGGLDHGLARAGWEHLLLCESDPWRRGVLRWRFPGVPVYDDVCRVADGEHEGRAHAGADRSLDGEAGREAGAGLPGGVDLLCGGFPCQDVSVAGQRRGLAGERSGLFHEYARIADALRPRWLLVENVPGLLSSNGGRDFGVVLGTLADLGYGLAWRILDSRYFGVPQRRRRVFIVGTLADRDPRAAAGRAGQVLAVGSRCPRHPAKGGEAGADVAVASLSGLGSGGPDDNDGQGGRLVALAGTLKGQRGKGGGGIGPEETLVADTVRSHPRPGSNSDGNLTVVAAPLSHGSNPNSNMAGRRREDDENLVPTIPQTFDWQMGGSWTEGGAKSRSWIQDTPGRARSLVKNKTLAVWQPGEPVTSWLQAMMGGDAGAAEAHAVEVLRRVRNEVGAQAFEEWAAGITPALREEAVLRSSLHGGRLPGETDDYLDAKRGSGGCTSPLARRAVLTLRRRGERRRSPSGRQSVEQLAGELGTALSGLPHPGAQAAWLLHGLWEASEGLGAVREALSTVQAVGRSAGDEGEPTHAAASVRRLTPTEAERLQALPDGWTNPTGDAPDSRRYAGLGDAVTASVGEWIGRRILAADGAA